MKKIAVLLLSSLLIFSLFVPMLVWAAEVFGDDFETGDFSNWTFSNSDAYVSDLYPYTGTYGAIFNTTGGMCYKTTAAQTTIFLDFYWQILVDLGTNTASIVTSYLDVSDIAYLLSFGVSRVDGTTYYSIWYYDDASTHNLVSATEATISTWLHVQITVILDSPNSEYHVSIDDVELEDLAATNCNTGTHTFNRLYAKKDSSDSANQFAVDDFYLYDTVPEPPEDTYVINYSNVGQNSTMLNTYCTFSALWDGNDTLGSWSFGWDYSGSFVYDEAVEFDPGTPPEWSNVTKQLEGIIGKHGNEIQWSINVTGDNGATNTTGLQYFDFTAVEMTFTVYAGGTFYLDEESQGSGSVWMLPDNAYNYTAVEAEGYDFSKYTINGTDFTGNPNSVSLNVSTYLVDNYQTTLVIFESEPTPTPSASPGDYATRGEILATGLVASLILIPLLMLIIIPIILRRKR